MRTIKNRYDRGSVLMIALLTVTILTLICATSLYIASQNTNAGMQTAGWQQSLTAAESGVDAAVRALNTGVWTNWKTVATATLPTVEPTATATPAATGVPTTSQYNYLPSSALSMTMQGEGAPTVSAWVTLDTAGGLSDSTGSWYRIRSTGRTSYQSNSIYKRVSNNRLDSDLRNTISMNFSRKGGSVIGPTRTIEVIMQPVSQGGSARALTLSNWLQMTGGGSVDAFSSPNNQYSSIYRDTSYPMLVAEGATGGQAKFANTGQTYVYGGVTYSGTAPTNVNAQGPPKDVLGQVSTPASVTLPTPSDPTAVSGQSGHYSWTYSNPWTGVTTTYNLNSVATYTGGGGMPKNGGNTVTSITATGNASSPSLYIINGDFTVPGGNTFTINPTTSGNPPAAVPSSSYAIVWVKGKFTTSGSGIIQQVSGSNVMWIVDNDITVSGSSYNNQAGTAGSTSFVGIGTSNNKFTDSGSGTFIGTINAPGYDGTISGQGDYVGAYAGKTMTISGSGSFHYDESLTGSTATPAIGNYAFASWFEDNSDPTHKDVAGNYVVY